MLRLWSVLSLMGGLAACGKSTRSAPDRTSSSLGGNPPADVAAPAGASTNVPPAQRSQESALLVLTQRWNQALASRQGEALRNVYAAQVTLYGKAYAREAAVALKRTSLAKNAGYTQSLGPVAIDWSVPNQPRARFEKKWSQAGKANAVMASLTFRTEDNQWRIAEESDAKTDQLKAGKPGAAGDCADVVRDLVLSTTEAKALIKGIPNWGTRVFTEENPHTVAIHEDMPDHLTTFGWFEVDIRTGAVRSTMPEEKTLVGDPRLVANVLARCKAP